MEPETRLAIDTATAWMDAEIEKNERPEIHMELQYTVEWIRNAMDCPVCKRCDKRKEVMEVVCAIGLFTVLVAVATVAITLTVLGRI